MSQLSKILRRSIASAPLIRSFGRSDLLLRKRIWVWPLLAAFLLTIVGYRVRVVVEDAIRGDVSGELRTILDAQVSALGIWISGQKFSVETAARSAPLLTAVDELTQQPPEEPPGPEFSRIQRVMAPWLESGLYEGWLITDASATILASSHEELIGHSCGRDFLKFVRPALAGNSVVSPPFPSPVLLRDADGEHRVGVPTMFAAAPIRDPSDRIVGVLGLQIQPERDFTRILQVGSHGSSGESYAFDDTGLMISRSRFDEELRRIGLIPDRPGSRSILNVEIRDPRVNMSAGERPQLRRSEQSLTRMAASATAGQNGVDVAGYRDYRGVPVVGAWRWLPDYGFGVATEMNCEDAYQPLSTLRRAFWGMFGLLALSAVAIFGFTIVVARLQRSARRSAVQARRLGQYTLDEELGRGGMGVVYKGRHAMLRRPTAIKLLDIDRTSDAVVRRFEREVQLTCQLKHPNTIAIYDYGRTPEGVFYYAMEYLDGINLEMLVDRFGPQPEDRVIHILRQICGSLTEAHETGLVHRDIKPANILLCRHGGVPDFVKVLDFGLVKAADGDSSASLSTTGTFAGTPLFMSPEAIQRPDSVDLRSDLYSLGAVGWFLLAGSPVFVGDSLVNICMKQVEAPPERPSVRVGHPLNRELENVILACLAKDPKRRPASAAEVAERLERCRTDSWPEAEARDWWQQFHAGQVPTIVPRQRAWTVDNADQTIIMPQDVLR